MGCKNRLKWNTVTHGLMFFVLPKPLRVDPVAIPSEVASNTGMNMYLISCTG
jgi:hypothetical protein